jgi:flagellar basal body rod protein FlgG
MSSGVYAGLSGLRARSEQLDRLASDIANVQTSGYKGARSRTAAVPRPSFHDALESAVDVVNERSGVDLRPGTIAPTGRDLDFAIEGNGFFVIDTPAGRRYTRNGNFTRLPDGTIATMEGHPVIGDTGTRVRAATGALSVGDDGRIRSGDAVVGRFQVVDISAAMLIREEGARFQIAAGAQPQPAAGAVVRSGSLESANVTVVESMAQLAEVARGFEALQRGMSALINEIDARAITELGRRS